MVIHIAAPEGELTVNGQSRSYPEGIFFCCNVNCGRTGIFITHLALEFESTRTILPSRNKASPPCSADLNTSEAWPYPTKERTILAYSMKQRQGWSMCDSVSIYYSLICISLQLGKDKVAVMKRASKILPEGCETSASRASGRIE